MKRVLHLATKDLLLLWRDKPGMFFTLIFPIIYATFFGYLFSGFGSKGRSALTIAMVDQDATSESRAFIEQLKTHADLQIQPVDDLDVARNGVRLRTWSALILIEPGFGQALRQPFFGEPARMKVGIDPVKMAESGMLQGILAQEAYSRFQRNLMNFDVLGESVQRGFQELDKAEDFPAAPLLRGVLTAIQTFLSSPLAAATTQPTAPTEFEQSRDREGANLPLDQPNPDSAAGAQTPVPATKQPRTTSTAPFRLASYEPIKIESMSVERQERGVITNPFAVTFPQGMIWAMMSCSATFGISLVIERRQGTLTRLRVAPLSRGHILWGKAVGCWAAMFVVCWLLFACAAFFFKVRPSDPGLLFLSILCTTFAFVGVMMTLAVLGKTEASAGGIGWAVLLIMAMFGGAMVPAFLIPEWMRTLGYFGPIYWSILAIEGALWRGFSYLEAAKPLLILVGIGFGGLLLGTRLMRWQED